MNSTLKNGLLLLAAGLNVPALVAAELPAETNAVTQLPTVKVTAQKGSQPDLTLPVSVTAVTSRTLTDANITGIKEAAIYSPNTFINQFTARAVSNPTFRGVSGSPLNPSITTFVDGVPQLNNYSSSFELLDVDQVEFVRGPQGALFGRNTAGGLINITSRRPSDVMTGWVEGQYGNYNLRDMRAGLSGPINDKAGFSLAGGFSLRDGYTKNDFTGHDLDKREAGFGKGQLLFKPSDKLEIRLILSGESDRDGDYALGDLGALRANPHHVSRDFEGFNHRDLMSAALVANYKGESYDFSSTTAGSFFRNEGLTDLDYTPFPGNTRDNKEQQNQFTQEFRLASSKDKPLHFNDNLELGWQSGLFIFTQDYKQSVVNNAQVNVNPVPPPPIFAPVFNNTTAKFNDWGMGLYGQGKLTVWDKLDFAAGLRFDYESKAAALSSVTAPALLGPATSGHLGDDYVVVSPQFTLDYRYNSNQMSYLSVARGYKAGGFNQTSPAGGSEYRTEHSWNYELGHKANLFDGRVQAKAAVYYVDWQSLQINQPVPGSGGTAFYIANAGKADSKGVELEVNFRATRNWDLFGSVGYDDARFGGGSTSLGLPVGGHHLPYAPSFTGNMGSQYSWPVCKDATVYVRASVTVCGDFEYDASNAASQDTYALADIRAGIRSKHWFVEGWADNAFDTHYVPIAIPFASASGYVGESGDPVTFGLRAGLAF